MSLAGALAGSMVGTVVLTVVLRSATELRLTRVDLPFLLGTAVYEDRSRAKVVGYAMHFLAGVVFSLLYWGTFSALGESGWALGATLGVVHAAFAGTALVNVLLPAVHPRMGSPTTAATESVRLEAPGFMLRNYGATTPLVTLIAHVAYGAIVGEFVARAG